MAAVHPEDIARAERTGDRRFLDVWLTDRERLSLRSLRGLKRRREWLAGRVAAKLALVQHAEGRHPTSLEVLNVRRGEQAGRPRATFLPTGSTAGAVSISHCGRCAVAAATRMGSVGIDVEEVRPRHAAFRTKVLSGRWADLASDLRRQMGMSEVATTTLIWSVKESVLKCRGRGLAYLQDLPLHDWADWQEMDATPLSLRLRPEDRLHILTGALFVRNRWLWNLVALGPEICLSLVLEPRALSGRPFATQGLSFRTAARATFSVSSLTTFTPGLAKEEDEAWTQLKERKAARTANGMIRPGTFRVIAGPCTVESSEQFEAAAKAVKQAGFEYVRGGAFKPRTSPYSFQGLGEEGLKILSGVAGELGLKAVTEVMDPRDTELVMEHAEVLQIGSRNMANFALLKQVGAAVAGTDHAVVLKRGFSATVEEWLLAAEYVTSAGGEKIILCERGIRTFETSTRFTLDLSAVPTVKRLSGLPVIVDPSHAAGRSDLVLPLAKASVAVGADGLMVESHDRPKEALCDGEQALPIDATLRLRGVLEPMALAMDRQVL